MTSITTDEKRFAAARFYGRLLLEAPKTGWDALGHAGNLILGLFIVVSVVNRKVAQELSAWNGISPAWALVPVGVFLLIGLLAANYRAFGERSDASESGPELEIDEMVDSSIDISGLESDFKFKVRKASNCEFKTEKPEPGTDESSP